LRPAHVGGEFDLQGGEGVFLIHHTYSIGEPSRIGNVILFRPQTEVFYTSTPS
jgi:hypothetical protein